MGRGPAIVLLAFFASAVFAETGGPSLLYVQQATSGKLDAIKGAPNEMELTLRGVAPSLVYFTDRPYRQTGTEPVATFVAKWSSGNDNFLEDPPNASLETSAGQVIIIELGRPRYDGASSTIRYRVRKVSPADQTFPPTFSHAFLVIDDATGVPNQPLYRVGVNASRQYIVWPTAGGQPLPPGYTDAGFIGTQQQCADYIGRVNQPRLLYPPPGQLPIGMPPPGLPPPPPPPRH